MDGARLLERPRELFYEEGVAPRTLFHEGNESHRRAASEDAAHQSGQRNLIERSELHEIGCQRGRGPAREPSLRLRPPGDVEQEPVRRGHRGKLVGEREARGVRPVQIFDRETNGRLARHGGDQRSERGVQATAKGLRLQIRHFRTRRCRQAQEPREERGRGRKADALERCDQASARFGRNVLSPHVREVTHEIDVWPIRNAGAVGEAPPLEPLAAARCCVLLQLLCKTRFADAGFARDHHERAG